VQQSCLGDRNTSFAQATLNTRGVLGSSCRRVMTILVGRRRGTPSSTVTSAHQQARTSSTRRSCRKSCRYDCTCWACVVFLGCSARVQLPYTLLRQDTMHHLGLLSSPAPLPSNISGQSIAKYVPFTCPPKFAGSVSLPASYPSH